MVVIKKHDNNIPIDFGDFSFNFVASDNNIKLLESVAKSLANNNFNETTGFEEVLAFSKKYWVELFGEEIYKKVLDFSEGSSITTTVYLGQVVKGIIDEFAERNNEAAFAKYL